MTNYSGYNLATINYPQKETHTHFFGVISKEYSITCKWYSCINEYGEKMLVSIHLVGLCIVDFSVCLSCLQKTI